MGTWGPGNLDSDTAEEHLVIALEPLLAQITRTMELVATSKLKRATDRVHAAKPYGDALREIVRSEGMTAIISTHDQALMAVADRT